MRLNTSTDWRPIDFIDSRNIDFNRLHEKYEACGHFNYRHSAFIFLLLFRSPRTFVCVLLDTITSLLIFFFFCVRFRFVLRLLSDVFHVRYCHTQNRNISVCQTNSGWLLADSSTSAPTQTPIELIYRNIIVILQPTVREVSTENMDFRCRFGNAYDRHEHQEACEAVDTEFAADKKSTQIARFV